ncbi:peptidoglycan-binding domain-containing protein [Actinomadura fulvescens]|uniref:Peptidoglycan recognition protein family domain-containing protein n=1 Tax=Actinomadura fulvescens TaxID=46160 RepID=A0ABN3Q8M2_9ACTN
MKYVKRSAWGARYGRGPTSITPSAGGVAVHYEGGGRLTGKPHSTCAPRVRSIESFHVNGRGWQGIAYNLLVCEHGYVFEGRGLGRRSAAQGSNTGNQNYYAVCALIGDKDPASGALLNGIRDAIDYLRSKGAGRAIKPHRAFVSTSCPGSALNGWVSKGAPRPGGKPSPGKPAPSKPSPAPKWPGRYLRYTTGKALIRGADVKQWQQRMRARGWSLDADGVYGPRSADVCRDFQREKRLAADGVVGPDTWRAAWSAPVT